MSPSGNVVANQHHYLEGSMTSTHDLYLQSKDTVTSLVTEENQHTMVPACPEWTLRDLLGHQAGEIEDGLNGNMDDLGAPHWTAAQVARHRHLDLDGVKAKWTAGLDAAGDAAAEMTGGAIADLVVHEFDVRGALGNTENRGGEIIAVSVPMYTGFLDGAFRANNIPALKLVTDVGETVIGEGEPAGELHTTGFELLRVATGRRSLDQIRALDWSVDPAPWLGAITLMPPRETALVE